MEQYFHLVCQCPGIECGNPKIYKWYHAGCSGNSEINEEAMLRCSSHKNPSFIMGWKFVCNYHINEPRKVDPTSANYALSVVVAMRRGKEQQWANQLTFSFEKQLLLNRKKA